MAGENPPFVEFVAGLSCRLRMHDPCEPEPGGAGSRIFAHRTGASDETAIPLCGKHRLALVTNRGLFPGMGASGRLRWELAQIDYVRAKWLTLS